MCFRHNSVFDTRIGEFIGGVKNNSRSSKSSSVSRSRVRRESRAGKSETLQSTHKTLLKQIPLIKGPRTGRRREEDAVRALTPSKAEIIALR